MSAMKIDLNDNSHKLITLCVMTVIWTILYAIVHIAYRPKQKLNKKIILDIKNRIISIVHGVSSFVMAAICFLNNEFK